MYVQLDILDIYPNQLDNLNICSNQLDNLDIIQFQQWSN